ncbi:MAG: glycosyltransferase family 4 protein, partial [Chloroflexi bacterium]|nr:glycosyltransferase family 4 protein [Chloroflexota bacterium]
AQFNYEVDAAAMRTELGIPLGAKTALFAGGSMASIKGLNEYLRAMAIVADRFRDLACLMPSFHLPSPPSSRPRTLRKRVAGLLGIYREGDTIHRLSTHTNLSGKILAAGFSYQMEKWIAASDVICVPHIQPHFSRTVMEGGAMKKPVVAFRIGGVEEVVQHRRTGLLVSAGNVTEFAEAVTRILEDPSVGAALGEEGHRQASRLFDAEKSADQVMSVYQELLHG